MTMKLAICIVSPPGYVHSEVFREIGETLESAIRALNHDVVLTTQTDLPGRRTVVLGSNLLSRHPHNLTRGTILYNLEQVEPGPWFESGTLELFRRYRVWDYSERNAAEFEKLALPRPRVVPIGWAPTLARIEPAHEDIDVLFYGSMNERRWAVIEELLRSGVRVETAFGVYGKARDQLIARSRIVLNIHFYEAKVFEIVRVSYLLANGRVVVSERGASAEEEAPFEQGVAFDSYEHLASRCVQLLNDEDERARLRKTGRLIMESRPATTFLKAALALEVLPLPLAPPRAVPSPGKIQPSTPPAVARDNSPLPAYYEFARPDVVDRINAAGKAILDVGCAAGAMGLSLLASGAREVVGIEIVADAVAIARRRLTAVYRFDLNRLPELPYPDGYFDVITFADVIEHLVDPPAVIKHLSRWLKSGGQIVCSIPNVRHESVLLPLLVQGNWNYVDAGILDRTHLRFYTRNSIQHMITGLGFVLDPEVVAVDSAPTAQLEELAALVGRLGGDEGKVRDEATAIQFVISAAAPRDGIVAAKPIADPWRGSRPTRLLLVPTHDDPSDCWEQVLNSLAHSVTQQDVTVGVALPPELLAKPPQAIHDAAAEGTLDLLLTEAPTTAEGWDRMLAGTGALLATAAAPMARHAAARVGVEVVEGRLMVGPAQP
jgi:SAM-dependent methyltransferase